KQLENIINTLIDGFKDEHNYVRSSCASSLGVISMNLTDKQLEGVFNALPNDLEYDYFGSYKEALEEISTKLNDKQLYLLVIHLLERAKKKCKFYVHNALSKISEDMWKRAIICGLKENIQMKNENTLMNKQNSNDCICKTDNDTGIQLLVVGLMAFNPRIQLSCDNNNINFDDLIRYCDEQAIEWKFPTHQSKWNNSNIGSDIQYPCLNNEIEE
ncbi:hypothetical protein RFI_37737, partial [Reticulomyxa filosa]